MPVDRYRNQGPEDSEDYHLFEAPNSATTFENELKRLQNENVQRLDGRQWKELRKTYLKTGVVSRAKGSAYVEKGCTKVLVSVYEPREIPRLAEYCVNGELEVEFRFASFSGKTRRPSLMQSDENNLSLQLKRTLEPIVCRSEFPNCQVDIHVLVLDDDGSSLAVAIEAAWLAVADAGIPMYDSVGAVALGFHNDHCFLDPTLEEEKFCLSSHGKDTREMGLVTLAYLPTMEQLASVSLQGCVPAERLEGFLDYLIEGCCQAAELPRLKLAEDVLQKCNKERTEQDAADT